MKSLKVLKFFDNFEYIFDNETRQLVIVYLNEGILLFADWPKQYFLGCTSE
jgi:hypothetical protein